MTDTTSAPTHTDESVEEFAARARAWLAANMPRIDPDNPPEADRGEEQPPPAMAEEGRGSRHERLPAVRKCTGAKHPPRMRRRWEGNARTP